MVVLFFPIVTDLEHRLVTKYFISSPRSLEHNELFAIMQYKDYGKFI